MSPLVDSENVNERRANVGLGTIEEYLGYFDMTWDLAKHKKKVAQLEAEKK
ncbi:MAG: hypothetical protein ACI849_000015 [Patiriisocius sp.]